MRHLPFWLASSALAMSLGQAIAAPASYSLEQAIDAALANNPELNIMQARIEQANAQLSESLASFYPQIKTSLSYQHSNNPAQAFAMIIAQRRLDMQSGNFNNPGFVDDYRPQVSASYSLFRGGQDYYNSQAAELNFEASELEKSAARNRLVNHVTAAYYGELAAMDANTISQRSIESVQSQLHQTQLGYEAGTVLKSDVLSLQVQLAEAQDAQIHAANAIELAQNMLKTLLGLDANDSFAINPAANKNLPESPASFEPLLNQALAQHPELKAAEKRIAIAEQQLAAAKAAHLPKADAFVSYGSDSKDLAYSSNRDNLTAGVMVEMEVFSGFATQEKINKAEHQLTAAKESARQSRLQIENELKAAQLKLQEALHRAEVSNTASQAAEEALRLVNQQRQAGVVTVTRYLETQVALEKALSRQVNARFDALRAEAALKQAIGTWQ
ncbi:MAG: TolC family protein [Methylomonas sp.]